MNKIFTQSMVTLRPISQINQFYIKKFENAAGKFVFYNYEEAFSNIHYVGVYLILKAPKIMRFYYIDTYILQRRAGMER